MTSNAEKGKYTSTEGSRNWEYLAIFCSTTYVLCIGTVAGWNSPSIVKLMGPESPIPITASEASTLGAVVSLGHMVASLLITPTVDRIGRKYSILYSAIPLIISWAMIIVANNVIVLYIARFLAGISLGFCVSVCPIYLSEIALAKNRGAIGMMMGTMGNIGMLFAFGVGPHLSISALASLFLTISIAFVGSFWFMPESPYFLAMIGKVEETEEVLEKLRGKIDIAEELELIVNSVTDSSKRCEESAASIKEIFTVQGNRRAFFIMLLFTTAQHFGGYFTIITYGQLIFRDMGSTIPDYVASVAAGVIQLISSVLTTFLIDNLGRKPLIFFSGFVSGLCNCIIGGYFYLKEYMNVDVSPYAMAPIVACLVLVFAFNCGLLTMQMVIMSEVFDTRIKALGTCLTAVIGSIMGMIGFKLYLSIAITWGYGHSLLFLTFFVNLWICTAAILCMIPETRGKTFLQIQKELNE